MKNELKQRGSSLFVELSDQLLGYVRFVREQMADTLDGIDTKGLRKRTDKISDTVALAISDAICEGIETARGRLRPRPARRVPTGLLILGGVAAGAGIVAVLLARRPDIRQRVTDLTGQAQRVLPKVVPNTGGDGGAESALKKAVETAVFSGAQPAGELRVDVEGRTVYLRGRLEDRGFVDQAVERAQSVDGVAAVINLVSV